MSATSADGAPHAGFGAPARPIPTGVQVLSTILFGAFAISVTAIAFAHFWPAGVGLALILGWRGGFVPLMGRRPDQAADRAGDQAGDQAREIIDSLRTLSPEARARSSGNASSTPSSTTAPRPPASPSTTVPAPDPVSIMAGPALRGLPSTPATKTPR